MTARSAADYRDAERVVTPSTWSRIWSQNGPGYLFLLPWFIGFFGLTLGPMVSSLYLSFTDFDLLTSPNWSARPTMSASSPPTRKFAKSMQVTIFFVLFSVPLKLAFALAVALLLNRGMRGLPLYRAVFYLPSLLGASVAIAVLWRHDFRRRRRGQRLPAQFRHRGPELDFQPALFAVDADRPRGLAVRFADDHFPRRAAPDPAGHVRGREPRGRRQVAGCSGRSRCRC